MLSPFPMSQNLKLRDLIRLVRTAKTQAEERAIIQKECADIRLSFHEAKDEYRGRNMLKLMYISMLGYSTEFGQMEVVKLLAQQDFGEKRIGYLALKCLLNETHEVLTLVENHVKKDLGSSNTFIIALALDTVADIAGEDMARDVLSEVSNLVDSTNSFLKKKACLAALRIVRRVPEFAEVFLDKLGLLFAERNHAPLLCSLSLVNECLLSAQGAAFSSIYRQQVPSAVRLLKQLVLSSYASEHDIGSVADPFLQVRILRFFSILGHDNKETSDAMNDVLAQCINNTDSSKNVGSAILYECTRTINNVMSDEGLRTMAVTTLGRFLTTGRDNNVRYVALSTLMHWQKRDPESVERHKSTIIDCLKDVDLSIRRKALELTVALIDLNNVRILVPDLLQYLSTCSEEMKEDVTKKLCRVIETVAPTAEWRVEMTIRIFKLARCHIPDAFAISFMALISKQPKEVQAQVVRALWEEISLPFDAELQVRQAVLLAGLWCVGEFCDLLMVGQSPCFLDNVANCVATITTSSSCSTVKQHGMTALMKVSCKYPQAYAIASGVFDIHARSLDCELQQRACEYATLFETFRDLAVFCFDRMPPVETDGTGQLEGNIPSNVVPVIDVPPQPNPQPPTKLFDDLFGDEAAAAPPLAAAPPAALLAPVVFEAFRGESVAVTLTVTPLDNSFAVSEVAAKIDSLLRVPITDLSFLVAVPRTSQIDIKPLPATEISPGQSLVQLMVLDNRNDPAAGKTVLMKIKLQFSVGGVEQTQLFQVSKDL